MVTVGGCIILDSAVGRLAFSNGEGRGKVSGRWVHWSIDSRWNGDWSLH